MSIENGDLRNLEAMRRQLQAERPMSQVFWANWLEGIDREPSARTIPDYRRALGTAVRGYLKPMMLQGMLANIMARDDPQWHILLQSAGEAMATLLGADTEPGSPQQGPLRFTQAPNFYLEDEYQTEDEDIPEVD